MRLSWSGTLTVRGRPVALAAALTAGFGGSVFFVSDFFLCGYGVTDRSFVDAVPV